MTKPNKFEREILKAAVSAQKFHIKMTGGQYVWYSHESFLQNYIAIQLFKKTDHCVYIDPSPKKIRESSVSASRKPPKVIGQRFDLVFWAKTGDKVKAILEIKETWERSPVLDDIRKISNYLKTQDGRDVQGYVLYYTDKRRNDRWKGNDAKFIEKRFRAVDEKMRTIVRNGGSIGLRHDASTYIFDGKDWDPWGFALFRC